MHGISHAIKTAVAGSKTVFTKNSKGKAPDNVNADAVDSEELGRRPLLGTMSPRQLSGMPSNYGTAGSASGSSSTRQSPERLKRDSVLDRVPEDEPLLAEAPEEQEDEWDLEEQGLYLGSYNRAVQLNAIVPLSSIVFLAFLTVLPLIFWPSHAPSPGPHPKYFPSPIPELLTSSAFWSLSYIIRIPLYTALSALIKPTFALVLFNASSVLLQSLLRLSVLPLLQIRHQMQYPLPTPYDPVFLRVWALALGWAIAEGVAGIAQGYSQLALYRGVMVPPERVLALLAHWRDESLDGRGTEELERLPLNIRVPERGRPQGRALDDDVRIAIDRDLDQLVTLKEREDIEEVYGMPFIHIPVFISCLQRLDALLLSLGITLLLSGAYLRSTISLPFDTFPNPVVNSNRAFLITFPSVLVLHLFLALLYSPPLLRKIGVHTAAYIGLLFSLGSLFSGLAMWGALS